MNILFISPTINNIVRYYDKGWDIEQDDFGKYPPLGLLYLIANLKHKNKHNIKLLDCVAEGLKLNEIEKEIQNFRPDLVAISCCTVILLDCVLIARKVKQFFPKCHICLGGPQVNDFPEETIKLKEIDSIIIGEGEYSFSDLVDALDKNISIENINGLYTKNSISNSKQLKFNTINDINFLKFPNRSYLKRNLYYNAVGLTKQEFATIITSRGCPMKCTFCATLHKKFRPRSVENVINEIKEIISMGYKEIFFQDDTFNLIKQRSKYICKEIIKQDLKFIWSFKGRANTMDEELMDLAAQAGCYQIHIGVETGTQEGLNHLKKGVTIKQLLNTFYWAKKYKIRTIADMMIGLPFEKSKKDIFRNIKILYKLKPTYAQFNILQPFPKTEIFIDGEKKGLFTEKRWKDWMINPDSKFEKDIWNEYFTKKELSILLKKVYHKFYFRPSYLIKSIFNIKNLDDLKNKINGVLTLLKINNS